MTTTTRDVAFDPIAGTYRVTPAGDLATSTGLESFRTRVLRRLQTALHGFYHLPGYGLNLKPKRLQRGRDLAELEADIERQLIEEEEVRAVRAAVSRLATGVVVVRLVMQLRTGASFTLAADFNPDGSLLRVT